MIRLRPRRRRATRFGNRPSFGAMTLEALEDRFLLSGTVVHVAAAPPKTTSYPGGFAALANPSTGTFYSGQDLFGDTQFSVFAVRPDLLKMPCGLPIGSRTVARRRLCLGAVEEEVELALEDVEIFILVGMNMRRHEGLGRERRMP